MVEIFPVKNELAGVGVKTPATKYLFNINVRTEKIDNARSEKFHTTVMKGLFACKRLRPDTKIIIEFLCTRVQAPYEDDCNNMIRLIKYIKDTKVLFLTLRDDDNRVMRWYVDASF